jgi:hypothetical protein
MPSVHALALIAALLAFWGCDKEEVLMRPRAPSARAS